MQNFGFSTFDMVSVHIYGQYGNGIRSMMGGEVVGYRFGKDMWLTEVGLSSCSANQTSEEVQRNFYQDVLENGWNLRHPNWRKIFFSIISFDGATCWTRSSDPTRRISQHFNSRRITSHDFLNQILTAT